MTPSLCLYSAISSNNFSCKFLVLFPHIIFTLCSSSASIQLPPHHTWTTRTLVSPEQHYNYLWWCLVLYPATVCSKTSLHCWPCWLWSAQIQVMFFVHRCVVISYDQIVRLISMSDCAQYGQWGTCCSCSLCPSSTPTLHPGTCTPACCSFAHISPCPSFTCYPSVVLFIQNMVGHILFIVNY